MTSLTKSQRNQLHDALKDAFPSWDELDLMVALQLEPKGLETITPRLAVPVAVLRLIQWAEARGMLGELVAAALAANPGNAKLKAFATEMAAGAPAPTPATAPVVTREIQKELYERLIWKAVAFASGAEFREAMVQREACVCRVEYPVGSGQGTGFLVGADLVVTNYHVLQEFMKQAPTPSTSTTVGFRFDYQTNAAGTKTNAGRVTTLTTRSGAAPWIVASSPSDGGLDYVVVRLDERVGDDVMSANGARATRGWLSPTAHTFEIGESLFVLQHPKAAPLKIAAGGVAKVQGTRVHYLANTLDGSSGSPVFTSDWKLAALHRGSDGIANLGVPFSAILEDLQESHVTLA